ncbi:MAG TPA: hypothetical protein VIL46_08015 [Gemmataceae bacterium]
METVIRPELAQSPDLARLAGRANEILRADLAETPGVARAEWDFAPGERGENSSG